MLQHEQLDSGLSRLELRVATTATRPVTDHGLVLVHGLPRLAGMGRHATGLLPELAEHLANESGWMVATGTLSGVGESTGTFSIAQWRQDLRAIIDRLSESPLRLSIAGFGLGGALALDVAAHDERIRGVATFATPSDMTSWMGDPVELVRVIERAELMDPLVPVMSPSDLADDVSTLRPLEAAKMVPPRRFLIAHGAEDRDVPVSAARDLLEAADGKGELRIIQGAGHWLRADPRMVATLVGWLDRH